MPPKKVAWLSQHDPLPAQIKELQEKLGDIEVVQITDTFQNHRAVIETVKGIGATYAVVVLPLSVIAIILDSKEGKGITWLRAQMDIVHDGKCKDSYKRVSEEQYAVVEQVQHVCKHFNKDTDVILGENGERHRRFREFRVLKSVETKTEPFVGEVNI